MRSSGERRGVYPLSVAAATVEGVEGIALATGDGGGADGFWGSLLESCGGDGIADDAAICVGGDVVSGESEDTAEMASRNGQCGSLSDSGAIRLV